MSIFQTKEYLDLFRRHFVTGDTSIAKGVFEILPDKKAVLLGMKPVLNGQELTDFGDVPDASKETVQSYIGKLETAYGATSVQFDYVREDSRLFKTLSEISPVPPVRQEVSPFIILPPTWNEYLESLERTDRKELRRKLKRLETKPHSFALKDNPSEEDFETFVRLHRLSDTAKDRFMTDPMKLFFKDLLSLHVSGWQQKLAFSYIEDKPAASVFYFENDGQILLYNSGYDPEQKYYSVGLLLVAHLIQSAIDNRKKVFDFLRGNERYKYDLGGKDMVLYKFILKM